jgi:hypothetical protein
MWARRRRRPSARLRAAPACCWPVGRRDYQLGVPLARGRWCNGELVRAVVPGLAASVPMRRQPAAEPEGLAPAAARWLACRVREARAPSTHLAPTALHGSAQ